MEKTAHTMTMKSDRLLVGGKSRVYHQAVCSCGSYSTGLESSRMHAVEAYRKHVKACEAK
jgi:hypothetical protein